MTTHLEAALDALDGVHQVAEHERELIDDGLDPASMKLRLLQRATTEALIDIAQSLRRLADKAEES